METSRDQVDTELATPRPKTGPKHLHLFFGHEGNVPIGVDPSFPLRQTASTADHLRWAEILVDAGVYWQARHQLDLLGEPDASSARAQWLHARLLWVQYRNARQRSRRRLDDMDGDIFNPEWWGWPEKIKTQLADATQKDPKLGPAWLLDAEVALDADHDTDFAHALTCAKRAHELLGETPAVLSALGRALRNAGQAGQAVAVLRRLPADSDERRQAGRDLQLAELEDRCHSEPIDIDAHLQWGRWCLRHDQHDRAKELFTKLATRCPDRAEGYYGLGYLAFLRPLRDCTETQKYTEAYRLCAKALNRNREFGLAYELAGSIFRNLRYSSAKVEFEVREPLAYYRRALNLDATCDTAMCELAEEHLRKNELEPASALLEKAAALDSPISMVYFLLEVIYQGRRDFEKMAWAYGRRKKLAPGIELSAAKRNEILKLCGFEY